MEMLAGARKRAAPARVAGIARAHLAGPDVPDRLRECRCALPHLPPQRSDGPQTDRLPHRRSRHPGRPARPPGRRRLRRSRPPHTAPHRFDVGGHLKANIPNRSGASDRNRTRTQTDLATQHAEGSLALAPVEKGAETANHMGRHRGLRHGRGGLAATLHHLAITRRFLWIERARPEFLAPAVGVDTTPAREAMLRAREVPSSRPQNGRCRRAGTAAGLAVGRMFSAATPDVLRSDRPTVRSQPRRALAPRSRTRFLGRCRTVARPGETALMGEGRAWPGRTLWDSRPDPQRSALPRSRRSHRTNAPVVTRSPFMTRRSQSRSIGRSRR